MTTQTQEQVKSIWNTPFTALVQVNWEIVILVGLLLIAALTRFYDLSSAAWSHDEAIHTHWSNDLYLGRGYIHNPIYHGPLLYHATALMFFLLGANDFSARAMPVLFGLVLIALPYFFRQWLGARGWVITLLLLLISPVVAHYSRVDRHDIYVEVFVVLLALAIMKYLTARRTNWLYFASAVLALAFTAMETTFIFMTLFGYFLAGIFAYDWLQRQNQKASSVNAFLAGFFGLVIAAYGVMVFLVERVRSFTAKERVPDPRFDKASFDLLIVLGTLLLPLGGTPLFIKFILPLFGLRGDPTDYSSVLSISSSAMVLVSFIILSAVIGLAWNWRRWLICAVWFYPIMLVLFTTVFTNPAGIGSGFVGSLGYWITQQPVQRGSQPQYYYLLVTLPLYEYLPYLFGVAGLIYIVWRRSWKRAAVFAAALVALLLVLAFIWFTPSVIPAMISSVPFFKGRDNLQVANHTVLLLALLVPLFFALAYDPDDESTRFPTLIGVWTIGCIVLFSWAGEKMPWLTIHMAIPLSFVAGYFMNDVLDADWRALFHRGAWIFAGVLTIGLLVLAFQVFFGPAPLSGTPLDEQARAASSIIGIVVVGVCAGIVFYVGMALGLKDALRVLAVTSFGILVLFTIRTTASAAYTNKDMAIETIVYAQGTPDVPNTMREIEELSRRLCAQSVPGSKPKINCDNGKIKVAYDDDSSWPFVWYLRDYRNAQFYGSKPGAPFDAEVVIVGDKNEAEVKPFLGNRYYKRDMRLVWWPDEGYKDLSWEKLFGGVDEAGNKIDGVLEPQNFKKLVRDVWFYRKYDKPLNEWSYVHRFSLYIRKDVANLLWQYAGAVPPTVTAPEEDPYFRNYVEGVRASAVIEAQEGSFNGPKNVAVDAEGNIYVVDTNNHRVLEYDSKRKLVRSWGGQGSAPGQFNEPWGIAVGKDGSIYVADTWNHRIQKFDAEGNFVTMWGTFGDIGTDPDADPFQLYGPRAIAIASDGNLWVTDTGNERVLIFSPDGEFLDVFGGTGSEPGRFLEPVGIAIDKDDNVYVADTWNRRIQKFSKDLEPLTEWQVEAWDSQSVVNKPYIAVDSAGNLYVSDPEGYRMLKFSATGNLLAVWGAPGSDLTGMQLPTGVAVAGTGEILVADSGNNRVLVFQPIEK